MNTMNTEQILNHLEMISASSHMNPEKLRVAVAKQNFHIDRAIEACNRASAKFQEMIDSLNTSVS